MSERRFAAGAASAAEAIMPDTSRFLDPFDDRILLAYYHEIARWHGYIRFLGLPHLRDNPDVPIDRLYVEPAISDSHIQPDRPTKDWPETTPVLQAVAASQRLVLLGDPGSGKSTLVSWIAWQLTQPSENAWTKRLGRLVPIPMILRDMDIGGDITWDALLDAFLTLPLAKPLNEDGKGRKRLTDLFERGQTVIMLDGLDEIGDVRVRKALQQAVFQGFDHHPRCRWLLTSRIIGYDEVRFDYKDVRIGSAGPVSDDPMDMDIHAQADKWHVAILAKRAYVAPFSDKQIEQFSHNWFIQHEHAEHERQQRALELVSAIASNEGTRHLARTPNLLTLIALIYRVYRWLPHGRAMLYDRIAEAYLESIDRFRGVKGLNYSLAQKKRWLAYVGFQMQLRRGKQSNEDRGREILVGEDQVHRWIAEAMGTTVEDAEGSAQRFLDYIARRSGLLLPRGEGHFGFMHLSFQEYFAACYIGEHVITPEWALGEETPPGTAAEDLHAYADLTVWSETLVLLFETLAEKPKWIVRLAEAIFGPDFDRWGDPAGPLDITAGVLLAELAVDRYAGLPDDQRRRAMERCWQKEMTSYSFDRQKKRWTHKHARRLTATLLAAKDDYLRNSWEAMRAAWNRCQAGALLLQYTGAGTDLSQLSSFTGLHALFLYDTLITDAELAHLSALTGLQVLVIFKAQTTDAGLAHLSALTELQSLRLDLMPITDAGLAHLSRCTKLTELYTSGTKVTDEGKKRLLKSLKRGEPK